MPIRICTPHSRITTKKYFSVARWLGVGCIARNGSFSRYGPRTRTFSCEADHQTMPPMPASKPTMLRMLQSTAPGVGKFATSASCGQLFV